MQALRDNIETICALLRRLHRTVGRHVIETLARELALKEHLHVNYLSFVSVVNGEFPRAGYTTLRAVC